MLADTVSSIIIVFGAIIIYFSNLYIIDPLLAIGISLMIFVWAWRLFKDSINILLETALKGINIDDVSAELKNETPEIQDIRDMHILEITSNMYSLTAHVLLLAATCYARSSKRFYNWLLHNKWFGNYIRNYREGKGVPVKVKVLSISFLWIAIGYSVIFVVHILLGKIILILIAIGVTIHILCVKTLKQ